MTTPTQAQIEAIWNDLSPQLKVLIAKATNYALTAAAEVGDGSSRSRRGGKQGDSMSDDWDGTNKHNQKLAEIQEAKNATIERCAQAAYDWFTLAPKYRTKENLLARIRALNDIKE